MLRPNPKQAQALNELRHNTIVADYLRASLEDVKTSLVTQYEPDLLRILQGEARALQFLIGCITDDFQQSSGKR